jgi:Ca2+-binding RTX toxin-like protein
LTNQGLIFGHLTGVDEVSAFEGGSIANLGIIRSDQIGIKINTEDGFVTSTTNAARGVIAGGTNAIEVDSFDLGAINLNNRGTIVGNIHLAVPTADDVIVNHGKIKGVVELFSRNDQFNGKGGTSGDIFAGSGNDLIIAGKGKTSIHVGTGNTSITSGAGPDKFIFDSAIGVGGDFTTIHHFRPGFDKIVLSEADFSGLGPHGTLKPGHFHLNQAAHNTNAQIIYVQSDGFLYYDSNGSLPGGTTHFATLPGHPPASHLDFVLTA